MNARKDSGSGRDPARPSRPPPGALPQGVVYTTGVGRTCPDCAKPLAGCECAAWRAAAAAAAPLPATTGGVVRLRRDTQQRGGKVVTVIEGVPLREPALALLCKELKQKCGAGGTVRDRVIEIQGDQRDKLAAELARRGYTVKRAGG